MAVTETPTSPTAAPGSESPSLQRAWLTLVRVNLKRQFRSRQMLGVALGLLLLIVGTTFAINQTIGWDRTLFRLQRAYPEDAIGAVGGAVLIAQPDPGPFSVGIQVFAETDDGKRIRRDSKPFAVFSRSVVFFSFLGFLLPLWTLSFASSALGNERESRSLIWLLTRPMPREAIYTAKFVAVLPWCIGINLLGFLILCTAGGSVGLEAFALYWPGIIAGTIAFTAVFFLIGAVFPRPAIICLLYAFFFETLLSELPVPGTLKRLSVNFYTRCILYDAAETRDYTPESAELFAPVSPLTAWLVILIAGTVFVLIGMRWFARAEYREEA